MRDDDDVAERGWKSPINLETGMESSLYTVPYTRVRFSLELR